MSILDTIKALNPANIIDKAGEAIDRNVTSDEERLLAHNELREIERQADRQYQDFVSDQQQQITDRHAADMKSDSRLSKRVRPATLVCLLLAVVVLAVTDGNIGGFVIKDRWVDLLETLTSLAFMFYFGGRSIEKAMKK